MKKLQTLLNNEKVQLLIYIIVSMFIIGYIQNN
jgi:hypothetical protein